MTGPEWSYFALLVLRDNHATTFVSGGAAKGLY